MSNIKGLDELLVTFNNLKNIDATKALMAGGLILMGEAQRLAPVDTGALRENCQTIATGKNQCQVQFNQNYSYFQEYGTPRMKAHPFVRPAIDNNSEKIVAKIKEKIEEIIGGIAK